MPKPNRNLGMGFDYLPAGVLNSSVLSANDLGHLAMLEKIPLIDEGFMHMGMQYVLEAPVSLDRTAELHRIAKKMLGLGLVSQAWQVLLRVDMVVEAEAGLLVVDRMD